jgi:hypothetical protein
MPPRRFAIAWAGASACRRSLRDRDLERAAHLAQAAVRDAEVLADLRDAGIEFVTYERAPYPAIAVTAFDRAVVARGETYQLHESRNKNLGDKRGRIRRIALRTPDGKQINIVAISTAPAEQLIAILLGDPALKLPSGRWQQENAFHHGDARWGINQLDDRAVEPRRGPILLVGGSTDRCESLALPREMHDANLRARILLLASLAESLLNTTSPTRSNSNATSKRSGTREGRCFASPVPRPSEVDLVDPLVPSLTSDVPAIAVLDEGGRGLSPGLDEFLPEPDRINLLRHTATVAGRTDVNVRKAAGLRTQGSRSAVRNQPGLSPSSRSDLSGRCPVVTRIKRRSTCAARTR